MPKLIDPRLRELALQAIRQGASTREVAAQIGVTHVTIARWAKEDRATPTPSVVPPEPATPATPEDPEQDPRELVRGLLGKFRVQSANAAAAGHHSAAVAAAGHAAKLVPALVRLDRLEREDVDTVRYSRAEIAQALESVEERARAYLARPLLCADCGRALSISWGGEKAAKLATLNAEDHSENVVDPRKT